MIALLGQPLPSADSLTTDAARAVAETPPPQVADLPDLTVTYYDVSGRDSRMIRRRMNALRPTDTTDGERVDATTRWTYGTTWSTRGGACLPETAEATLSLQMRLPRLTNYAELSRSERERWDRYMTGLLGHERNHAMSAVRALPALVQAMRGATSCETMQAAAQAVFARVSVINADYDRRTRHGISEGIVY